MKKKILSMLNAPIKNILKNIFGINVSKESLRILNEETWIKEMGFQTVLDIGANVGNMTEFFRKLAPNAEIYSFEPIPQLAKNLNSRFENDKKVKVYPFALGSKNESLNMFLNPFHYSSSILPLGETSKQHLPQTDNTLEEIQIEVRKLDEVLNPDDIKLPCLIKVDVQGYEDRVIDGGEKIFSLADIAIIEIAARKDLYEGESLFDDIYSRMKNLGFEYRGNYDQYNSPKDGKVLYFDGIFEKSR